jgi:hypothetical protein
VQLIRLADGDPDDFGPIEDRVVQVAKIGEKPIDVTVGGSGSRDGRMCWNSACYRPAFECSSTTPFRGSKGRLLPVFVSGSSGVRVP